MEGYILTFAAKQIVNDWLVNNNGNYLEIGSYYGVMVSELAEAFPDRIMYCIDPFIADGWTGQEKGTELSEIEKAFIENTKSHKNIKLNRMTTKQVLEKKLDNLLKDVTVIFVDGSHHFDDILIDIDLVDAIHKKTDNRFMVLFDDLHIQDVQRGVEEFRLKYKEYIFSEYSKGTLLTFIMRPYNESKKENS